MKYQKDIEWTRLDNASKIFPAVWSTKDPKVFRLSCELNETVEPVSLQKALDMTLEDHPLYKSVLRKGVFWYYLEKSDIRPEVREESETLCSPIYLGHRYNLLFRVVYYNKRINLEVFHVLSDGAGALLFLQTLVYRYLTIKHEDKLAGLPPQNDNPSMSEQMDNSFGKHFIGAGKKEKKRPAEEKAYQIRGKRTEDNRFALIEGCMSVEDVLNEAHKYQTTLTVFLAALFLCSISKKMGAGEKMRPVVLTVPVNLRQYYESLTARNFFSNISIGYRFGAGADDLAAVIATISESFKKQLTRDELDYLSNRYMRIEQNLFARIVPLPIKDIVLRMFDCSASRRTTTYISNIGKIDMPAELSPYIRQFSVCTSARRPQMTLCSFGGRLVVSITSPYRETDIQRTFFQQLSGLGIEVEITTNIRKG
jgi:NRPS condensation-like uncharacterized protein